MIKEGTDNKSKHAFIVRKTINSRESFRARGSMQHFSHPRASLVNGCNIFRLNLLQPASFLLFTIFCPNIKVAYTFGCNFSSSDFSL